MKNMDTDGHRQSPETIKEIGIHLGYMRDDIADMKQILASGRFVDQKSFNDFIEAAEHEHSSIRRSISDLEAFRDSVVGRIALGAVMIVVAMLLSIYGLDKFI